MPFALRWTRPFRAAARRLGLLRDPTRAAARSVERYLDGEGTAAFARSGVPGLAVVVRFAEGREVARWLGTAGTARPVGPDTLFQVLSLSKPVAAMCALALVDDGLLSLDEPVWRRLPSWRLPAHRTGGFDPDGVTLRRLLSHSAGLNVEGFGWIAAGAQPDVRALLARDDDDARTLRIVAPPGSGLRYSGGGYALVERLVEEVTGKSFSAVVRERLFAPLGIAEGGYEPALALSPRLATPHDAEGRPLPIAGLASPAGAGLVATAGDVATLWALVARGARGAPAGKGVLSEAACRALLAPNAVDDKGAVCGLGMYVRERRGDRKYMHVGYDRGWYLHAEGLLGRRVVTVLLSNGDSGRDLVPAMAHALRERLFDAVV